jgi:sulfur-carrier protein
MVRVTFTANLRRHVECPSELVDGHTVRAALDLYFTSHPRVRSYVLDEAGSVRKHVVVFVGETQLVDLVELSDPVSDGTEIYVMQALSGG